MVIGHDQLHAARPVAGDLDGVRSAVAGDDQRGPACMELLQRVSIETVSLRESVGDVGDDVSARRSQTPGQRGAGRDAVGVIVTVHGDAPAVPDRVADKVARDRHVLEKEWVGRLVQLGRQPGIEVSLLGHTAPVQNLAEHRRVGLEARLGAQRLGEHPGPTFFLQSRPHYGSGL